MKSFTISAQKPIYCLYQPQQDARSPQCKLQWRQGQLLVRFSEGFEQPYLASVGSEQGIARCLKHSPVRLVRIDATLGEAALKRWANACEQANKPMFLRGTGARKRLGKQSQLSWWVKMSDWIAAVLLAFLLSPVMLAIVVLLRYVYSSGAIFSKEWRVGSRGKLFRAIYFRTREVDDSRTTPGRWMCKYSLDKLPLLFNILRGEMSLVEILRGEMSLVEPRSSTLSDAVLSSTKGAILVWRSEWVGRPSVTKEIDL